MRRPLALFGAATAVLAPLALAAPAGAEPLPTTVSIRVELDLPSSGSGPAVFQVTDTAVGVGPELTGDDLTSNPSEWCGSLNVDVDNVAQTITVSPDESCDFETATVRVTGQGIDSLNVVSDTLWETNATCVPARTASASSGVANIAWSLTDPETHEPCSNDFVGVAVFSYTVVAPTTTSTTAPPQTTPSTAAPTTAPRAASPAVVSPRFTG